MRLRQGALLRSIRSVDERLPQNKQQDQSSVSYFVLHLFNNL